MKWKSIIKYGNKNCDHDNEIYISYAWQGDFKYFFSKLHDVLCLNLDHLLRQIPFLAWMGIDFILKVLLFKGYVSHLCSNWFFKVETRPILGQMPWFSQKLNILLIIVELLNMIYVKEGRCDMWRILYSTSLRRCTNLSKANQLYNLFDVYSLSEPNQQIKINDYKNKRIQIIIDMIKFLSYRHNYPK